ncbi:MAG: xanthine dehydrogenase small subunit [Rhodobacteraceae bacterium]|nr:MAG: xanthine dehydrogenase small subunit [Paracoccaceae bacterium]
MDDAIRFALNGAPVAVRGVRPTTTLLDWLRETRGLKGTKEGCAEGDCGACTVAVREVGPDGRLRTVPINACIQLLPMMHGRDVVTVEALAGPDGALSPVQQAMAELHGSQCGFCTPGFVMTLWAARRAGLAPEPAAVAEALAGNLCRCTGYGPILAAAARSLSQPVAPWEETDAAVAERLSALGADGPLDYAAEGRRFLAPTDLDALADLAAALPEATLVSGATDVGLWVTKALFDPETIIWTGRVAEMKAIRREGDALLIGAGATYAEALAEIEAPYPDIGALIRRIGGGQVRAAGAVGANIANGSPIGDMPPALIAAGARLLLRHGSARREMPLEAFFLDYRKQDRRPGEIVEAVRLPLPAEPGRLRCHKVSKRFDQDITAVLGCFDVAVEGGVVASARLAYGGMAGVPKRAAAAEAALVGRPWTEESVRAAMIALERDFAPLTDMRASAAYRMTVARNLLMRHFIETTQPHVETRLSRRPAA